jgi:hypothetical protein
MSVPVRAIGIANAWIRNGDVMPTWLRACTTGSSTPSWAKVAGSLWASTLGCIWFSGLASVFRIPPQWKVNG